MWERVTRHVGPDSSPGNRVDPKLWSRDFSTGGPPRRLPSN